MRSLAHGLRSLVVVALPIVGCGDDGGAEGTTGTTGTTGVTTAESTAGAEPLCNGWSEDDRDGPWLELYGPGGQQLAAGGTLELECGGQGSWMFPIYPEMGGWEPAGPGLLFSVEVVVEGFPGPFGSFYDEPEYGYDLSCSSDVTLDGGFSHDCIAVLPPDDAQLPMLDGAPATVHVQVAVDGGDPLVVDLADMTISAPAAVLELGCSPF